PRAAGSTSSTRRTPAGCWSNWCSPPDEDASPGRQCAGEERQLAVHLVVRPSVMARRGVPITDGECEQARGTVDVGGGERARSRCREDDRANLRDERVVALLQRGGDGAVGVGLPPQQVGQDA